MASPSPRAALAARARRLALIRRRVVAATLAAFVLAWGVIAFHGTMGAGSAATASTSDGGSSTSTATTDGGSSSASTDGTSGAASGLAPATTAQS